MSPYKSRASEVICLHAKKEKRYSAAWKNFNAHDAKAIAEAGIQRWGAKGAQSLTFRVTADCMSAFCRPQWANRRWKTKTDQIE